MLPEKLQTTLDGKLWTTADRIIDHYKKKKYLISESESVDTVARYRLHLVCRKKYEVIGIEIRERCNIESFFENFVVKCQAGRVFVKIYFAVPEKIDDEETIITHAQRSAIKDKGVGLLIVKEDGSIIEDIGTISCNRRFALEPGSSLGNHGVKIAEVISKYNSGSCLDALRDLCEIGEMESFAIARKAAKKSKLAITEPEIALLTWEDVINILSTSNYKGINQTRIISDKKFTNTLKSFKDKRNLSDHYKSAQEIRKLEEQYPEAMLEGIRVIRNLVKLRLGI